MRKICNYIFLAVFGIILLLVPALSIAMPKEITSFYENRILETKPELSIQSLANGDYFAGWDSYFSDHIVGRTTLLKLYSGIQLALPRVEVNNVIESDTGALLNSTAQEVFNIDFEKQNMDNKTEMIKNIAEYVQNSGAIYCYVGVPEQRYIYYDEYPEYMKMGTKLVTYAEERIFDALKDTNAIAVNMRPVFESLENPKDYYLSIDTHYNFDGALLTYRTLMQKINERLETTMKIYSDDELVFHVSDKELIGAQSRAVCNLQSRKEYIKWAEPAQSVEFTRMDNGAESEPFVYKQGNAQFSAYGDYMSGDMGETIIKTNQTDKPKVLMYGDSFTNPLETLIYASCSEFRSLDFRHYDDMTLYEYIDMYKPDIVIAVRDNISYNMSEGNGQYC